MSDLLKFAGKVVRVEANGFGIVEFDKSIRANTHGVFSTTLSEPTTPIADLAEGMHVSGVAEFDEKDLAAIRRLQIDAV